MGFNSSAEVAKYIGGIFESAFEDPEIGPKLVDTELVIAFDFTEPEAVVVVDMVNKSVREGLANGPAPTSTMSMTADTGQRLLAGQGQPAAGHGQEEDQGRGQRGQPAQAGAARGRKLYPVYIERLKADGRDDLIA